jgi:hypothetical protein
MGSSSNHGSAVLPAPLPTSVPEPALQPSLAPKAATSSLQLNPALAAQASPGPRESFTFSPPVLSRPASVTASGHRSLQEDDSHPWLRRPTHQRSLSARASLPTAQGAELAPANQGQESVLAQASSSPAGGSSSAQRAWHTMWAPEVQSNNSSSSTQHVPVAATPVPSPIPALVSDTLAAARRTAAASAAEGGAASAFLASPRRLSLLLAAHPLADVGLYVMGDSTGSFSAAQEDLHKEQADAVGEEEHGNTRGATGMKKRTLRNQTASM